MNRDYGMCCAPYYRCIMHCCKYYESYRNTTLPSLKAHKSKITIILYAFHSVFATFSKKVTIKLVMMLFINSNPAHTIPTL